MADLFDIAVARKLSGGSGGGGGGTTVEALSVTQNGTYTAPTGKAYSPVTVNVSGGSSDFSTATVTATYGHTINGAFYTNFPPEAPFEGGTVYQNSMSDTLVLYKGSALIIINDPVQSISGNIQDMGEGGYLVTGDCTIVFL